MRHFVISGWGLATIWFIACNGVARADEAEPVDNSQQEAADTAKLTADAAAAFRLAGDTRPEDRIALSDEPLLKWSNPSVGRVYGSVFVWTDAGRPAAIASIYRWYSPFKAFTAEFVSVADQPFRAQLKEKEVWVPRQPGISWQHLPQAPPSADSPRGRLSQMRNIVAQFSATLTDTRSDAGGTLINLRTLTKPLMQYDSGSGPSSGGVFAFVTATDPEVLLLLEARKNSKSPGWYYALARMNQDSLEVRHHDKLVWSVPAVPRPWEDPKATYMSIELPRPER